MDPILVQVLACPRCRAPLGEHATALRCTGCAAEFAVVESIPRLNDGATQRDPKIAAEWEAQRHAKALYLDENSVVNHLESLVLPRMITWLGDVRGAVLDLGCGVGYLGRAWARQKIQNPLIGLDLQVALLDSASEGYVGRVEGDVHQLPFRDGAFSAVVVANALHHMSDPVRALREVRRVLSPGGTVVSSDPREFAVLEIIKRTLRKRDMAFTEYHRAFPLSEYRELFQQAGFTIERIGFADPVGPLVATGLDMLKVGRLGMAKVCASVLERADDIVTRADATGRAGFTVIAEARRA